MREPTTEEMKMVIRHLQLLDGLRATQVDTLVGALRKHIDLMKGQPNMSDELYASLVGLDKIMTSQHKSDDTVEMLEKSLLEINRAITG